MHTRLLGIQWAAAAATASTGTCLLKVCRSSARGDADNRITTWWQQAHPHSAAKHQSFQQFPMHYLVQSCFFDFCLQHHADPTLRNNHGESPLDLAAQYGRLDTVQLLLRKHPTLLADKGENISPLHLASRNGHRNIVQVLLENGFSINTRVRHLRYRDPRRECVWVREWESGWENECVWERPVKRDLVRDCFETEWEQGSN